MHYTNTYVINTYSVTCIFLFIPGPLRCSLLWLSKTEEVQLNRKFILMKNRFNEIYKLQIAN